MTIAPDRSTRAPHGVRVGPFIAPTAQGVAVPPRTVAGNRPGGRRPPGTRPVRYAVGMLGTSLPINMFLAFMAFYYVDTLGMDVRAYAAVMGGYALLDAVDNPVYGYLSDRTRSRWGRRRPWLVLGAPLLAVFFIAFFTVPSGLAGTGLVVWFAVFTVLTGTTDSMVNANYGALLPELYPEERRRAVANAFRQGFMLVAMIVSVALTPMIAAQIGYSRTAMVFGVVAAGVVVYSGLGAREDPAAQAAPTPGMLTSVKAILGNRKFWLLAVVGGLYSAAMALVLAAVPFFVKYTLGLPDAQASYLLIAVILTSMLCLALWARLVARLGALRTWRVALVVLALALASMSLADSLGGALIAGALVGLGYSGVMATVDLVVARLLDEDTARTGVRREGMFLAAFGFVNRLNAAVKALAFLGAFALYGFQSGDAPGDRADEAARFLLVVVPCALLACAAILSRWVQVAAVPHDGARPHAG